MCVSNEVIIERISNLKESVEKGFQGVHRRLDENEKDHANLDANQKFTNGKVRKLEVWKGTIIGAIAVIVFIAGFCIRDYLNFKESYVDSQKEHIRINENIRQIDGRLQSIEEIIIKE